MTLNIALVGNPSSGLTTLFNRMTGGTTHSGNFSSKEIATKEGPVKGHKNYNVIELPGLYSLSDYSVDDISTRKILLEGKPDVIINIVDATNIERNLYLTLQLMELGIPMVVALNMMDEVKNNSIEINLEKLSEELTIPVTAISASKNEGIHDLIHDARDAAANDRKPKPIDFCSGYVHAALHSIAHLIEGAAEDAGLPLRFTSSKLVEGDSLIFETLSIDERDKQIVEQIVHDMEVHLDTDREAAMSDMRYAFIDNLCKKVVKKSSPSTREQERSIKMDKILTNKFLAIPIFLVIMMLVFYFTFDSIGALLSNGLSYIIEQLVNLLSDALIKAGAAPALHALIIDGICNGVGSVLSFLPVIAVLFFFLSILEDSGYMPRVAFVMDKILRRIGLSGRSIVPMLVGFGCSVPAIMATRGLPSKRDRHLTIALIPYMSCSAKLPLYAIFVTAFFQDHRALIMITIYVIGIIVAIISAKLYNLTVFRNSKPVPFIMVLPAYRIPAAKSVMLRM